MVQYYSFNEVIGKIRNRSIQFENSLKIKKIFKLNMLFSLSYLFHKKSYKHKINSILCGILQEYDKQYSCNIEKKKIMEEKYNIWVMWWQGLQNMPPTIQACYKQLKMSAGKYRIVLITKDNVQNYIEIPDVIKDKVHRGIMTQAALSDYVRVLLLKLYGGLWVDSSIYCLHEIGEIDKYFFYTGKKLGGRKWTSFLMATNETGMELFARLEYYMRRYWQEYDVQFDYFFIDLLIEYLYRNDEEIHKIIDAVPENNQDIFTLLNILSEPYDENTYKELQSTHIFQKISQKKDFKLYKKKKPTYGNVLLRI